MAWDQVKTFLRNGQGQVFINPAKDYIQPFELSVTKPNAIVKVPAGQRVGPFPLTAQYDGPIECFYVKVVVYEDSNGEPGAPVQDYDIDFLLEHPGKRIQFSNRFVPLLALSGDGGRPYVLPETIFIPPVQSLNITYVNNDGVNDRHVEFVMGAIKFYPNQSPGPIKRDVWAYIERRERTYAYWQTTDEAAVLNASDVDRQFFMTIPDKDDLEVLKLTAQSTGEFRCRIRDGQNDRALTGDRIHGSLLFGGHQTTAAGGGLGGSGGIFPARWATSWLIRRATKVELDLTDLSGAQNTIKAVFGGRKVSYVG
jgi:hypothetical protein